MSVLKNIFSGKYIVKQHEGRSVYLRKNNVDNEVFDYVFKDKYHRPDHPLKSNCPVILDLGVNIGLSVVDFKLLYPSAIVYGYELDKDNAEMAIKNTAGLPDVYIYNQGIWHEKKMVGISGKNADAFTIDEKKDQGEHVMTTTLHDVISDHGLKKIDYIKMDIEGAEHEIFQHDLDWLDITGQIKVEVHNGQAIFDFITSKLDEKGFITEKDTHHWSTIIGYKK